jgi:hypothetical protein
MSIRVWVKVFMHRGNQQFFYRILLHSKQCRNLDSTVCFYYYQIADGMTIQITTVNLLLETRGGVQRGGGATW